MKKCPKCQANCEFVGGKVIFIAFSVKVKYAPNQWKCTKCGEVWYDRFGELIKHPCGCYW